MIEKIKNVGKITSGIYSQTYSSGEVYYIQARNFDSFKTLKTDFNPNLLWNAAIEKHFLNKGDVLVAVKGFDNFAAVYHDEVKPAVASSMFLIIRNIDKNKILPEFLVWFINHPNTQDLLGKMAKGTSLPSINKEIIGNLEVEIPSTARQELVLKISELRIKDRQLKKRIEELREILLQKLLIKAITNE
jgi:restriction endonuclease S subunit